MTIDDEHGVVHGLELQARSLAPVLAEADRATFLVGTQSLKFENQICLIDFDEDSNQIQRQNFAHKIGEIWQISSSPIDAKLISTCYNSSKFTILRFFSFLLREKIYCLFLGKKIHKNFGFENKMR